MVTELVALLIHLIVTLAIIKLLWFRRPIMYKDDKKLTSTNDIHDALELSLTRNNTLQKRVNDHQAKIWELEDEKTNLLAKIEQLSGGIQSTGFSEEEDIDHDRR